MRGFLDRMGARARATPEAAGPALHLRPRTRFEPDPLDEVGAVTVPGAAWSGSEPSVSARSRQGDTYPAPAERPGVLPRPGRLGTAPPNSPDSTARVDPGTSGHDDPGRVVSSRAADAAVPPATSTVSGSRGNLPSLDPVEVVRRHVVPQLVSDGVLPAGADPEVALTSSQKATTDDHGARRIRLNVDAGPGTGHRTADGARDQDQAASMGGPRAASTAPVPARPPDVHVHIGRIEVVHPAPRQPPPASPRATPRRTTSADHASYLARRRETS